jgi:hypothetical protein
MRAQDFKLGKRGRVADEVHFIRAQPGANTRGLQPALIDHGINGFGRFSFEIKTSISPVKPSLDCLHHSELQQVGGAWVVHSTGQIVGTGCSRGTGHGRGTERRCGRSAWRE